MSDETPRLSSTTLLFGALLWSLVILGFFVESFRSLVGGSLDPLFDLALGAGTVYGFGFCGYRVLRRVGGRAPLTAPGCEMTLFEVGLGAGVFMLSLFVLGMLGLFETWVAWTFVALVFIGNHLEYWKVLCGRWRARGALAGNPIVVVLLIVVGAMSLMQSLAPPTSHDALVYHLALPVRYIDHGGIHHVPGSVYAQFPQNVEMLFTFGMLLKGPELAKLYHWIFGVLSCVGVAALARHLHGAGSRSVAAASFATVPSVVLLAGWAYVDLVVVFYTLVSLLAFLHFWRTERTSWLVVAAVLAGIDAGCKYTGGLQGLILVGGVLVLARVRARGAPRAFRDATIVAGVVAAVAGAWWLKNFAYTGNPLFPFAYGLFGGEGWDAERSSSYLASLEEWGGDRDWLSTFLVPLRLTMSGMFAVPERFDGVIGCVFLISAPVVLVTLRRAPVPVKIAAATMLVHGVFWLTSTRQVRFLLPALAIASALVAVSLPLMKLRQWPSRALRACLTAAFAVNVLIAATHFAHQRPMGVVLGQESRPDYLHRVTPGGDYAVFESIEQNLPADSYIFFAALGNPGFLCKRPFYSDSVFENHTLMEFLESSGSAGELFEKFSQRGFTHVLFRLHLVFSSPKYETEIPLADQKKFAEFLNLHGTMLAQEAGTYLYELRGE